MLTILGLLGLALFAGALIPNFSEIENDDEMSKQKDVDSSADDEQSFDTNEADIFLDGQEGSASDKQETLQGGGGSDYIRGGANDILFGGKGEDTFEVFGESLSFIQDLEDNEVIIINYSGAEPAIEFDEMDHGTMIFADGRAVVEVKGAYNLEGRIRLVSKGGAV